ncbi:hypothetical protein HWV62_21070 [Athelia sp. TMB]|nr:hypothetical protein HWV62_21070 [Athelia sp. TMB]
MRATNALVVGPCLTNFLRRNPPGKTPLSVIMSRSNLRKLKAHLEQAEGYEAWESEEETLKGTSVEGPTHVHGARAGLRSGTLLAAVLNRVEPPLGHVVTLQRKVLGGRSLFIILSTAKSCLTKSLMTPNTSESNRA